MLSDLFKSKPYQVFMHKLFWTALVVTALGLAFFLLHLKGGRVMLLSGGMTLVVCGLLYVVQMIVENRE